MIISSGLTPSGQISTQAEQVVQDEARNSVHDGSLTEAGVVEEGRHFGAEKRYAFFTRELGEEYVGQVNVIVQPYFWAFSAKKHYGHRFYPAIGNIREGEILFQLRGIFEDVKKELGNVLEDMNVKINVSVNTDKDSSEIQALTQDIIDSVNDAPIFNDENYYMQEDGLYIDVFTGLAVLSNLIVDVLI